MCVACRRRDFWPDWCEPAASRTRAWSSGVAATSLNSFPRRTSTTDGAFDSDGYHPLPLGPEDLAFLTKLFSKRFLDALVAAGHLLPDTRSRLQSWRHSGFSVDGSVRLWAGDTEGLGRLLRYISRGPLSTERIEYESTTGRVRVKSAKRVGGLRRTVAVYDAGEFLALLCQQVPPPGCHLIRYYGWYSARTRARRREEPSSADGGSPSGSLGTGAAARRKRWAQLIRLVFEADPLVCPSCGGELRFVSFITVAQAPVIERMLTHLGVEWVPPPSTGPPDWVRAAEARSYGIAHPEFSAEVDFVQADPSDGYGEIDVDAE